MGLPRRRHPRRAQRRGRGRHAASGPAWPDRASPAGSSRLRALSYRILAPRLPLTGPLRPRQASTGIPHPHGAVDAGSMFLPLPSELGYAALFGILFVEYAGLPLPGETALLGALVL